MTQHEKVLIFRDQRGVTTDLHDTEWNEKVLIFRDIRGVTTDLHDTEWESDHFSWPTRGHNWPFRCLDRRLAGLEFLTKPNNHSFSTVVKRDKYNLRYYICLLMFADRITEIDIEIHVIIDQYFNRGNREHWTGMWWFDSFARNIWCWCKLMV